MRGAKKPTLLTFLGKFVFLLVISQVLQRIGARVTWVRQTFFTSWDMSKETTLTSWLTAEVPVGLLYSTADIPLNETTTFRALYSRFPEKSSDKPFDPLSADRIAKELNRFERIEKAFGDQGGRMACMVTPIGPAPRLMILDGRHRASLQYFYSTSGTNTITCQIMIRRSNIRFLPEWWKFFRSGTDGASTKASKALSKP